MEEYRLNAGCVVFNASGKVLVCERYNSNQAGWQFPQGGIEKNETPENAALRELKEETGIVSVIRIITQKNPTKYDFPPEIVEFFKKSGRNTLGQNQYWSLFYFFGKDSEINFETNPNEVEFKDYMWIDIEKSAEIVVDWKKNHYLKMIKEFNPIIKKYIEKLK